MNDSWIFTTRPRLNSMRSVHGNFFTCTDLNRSKAPETVFFLELSSVCALTAELIRPFSRAHNSTDPQKTRRGHHPSHDTLWTVDILCWSCLSHPKKGQTPHSIPKSQQMIAFCFHLCLALFISSPLFCFWSWIMTFFSTVVRVLSRERERERKRTQENDLAELSLWVALWWVDLILTAFDNLNYLWFLRGYEHLRGKKKCYDSCRTFCNIYKLQRP